MLHLVALVKFLPALRCSTLLFRCSVRSLPCSLSLLCSLSHCSVFSLLALSLLRFLTACSLTALLVHCPVISLPCSRTALFFHYTVSSLLRSTTACHYHSLVSNYCSDQVWLSEHQSYCPSSYAATLRHPFGVITQLLCSFVCVLVT